MAANARFGPSPVLCDLPGSLTRTIRVPTLDSWLLQSSCCQTALRHARARGEVVVCTPIGAHPLCHAGHVHTRGRGGNPHTRRGDCYRAPVPVSLCIGFGPKPAFQAVRFTAHRRTKPILLRQGSFCSSCQGNTQGVSGRRRHSSADVIRDLHAVTDLALMATKRSAQPFHGAHGRPYRHLWLTLADLEDADRRTLLNVPVAPSGLFGDAMESWSVSQRCRKRAKAMSHVMHCRSLHAMFKCIMSPMFLQATIAMCV
ncbi:uncharacterized protein LOC132131247 [Carassius carassius]|uniref:uncharacterized protein LOC132131247 n=1 Tax=Carassius carassius TaxID=217509 RepID=UPI0028690BC3|nr:uncharacterized protein LOC132131247 [Carassius carassius]